MTNDGPTTGQKGRGEGGFVALWMAVVVFVLLGVAAFAVDMVHAYLVGQEAQNAADAAALAGVVNLPDNPTQAQSMAIDTATDNGFTTDATTTVTPALQPSPTQLRVDVTRRINTWFAGVMGVKSLTVHKYAVSDYQRPVAMGSPSNTFGNQPDCTNPCTNTSGSQDPQLWFNVAGPNSGKVHGDAYGAQLCQVDTAQVDNCPSGTNNSDYDGTGYTYVIRNTNPGGTLRADVFDPAFVAVNDLCNIASLTTLHDNLVAQGYSDAARYTSGSADPHCTGDQYFAYGVNYGDLAPTTTYTLSYDPGTPWTTADDVQQCSMSFTGYKDDLWAGWQANNTTVRQYFRKWVTVCTVNGAQKGDYVLRISTSAGTGHNRGALRAAMNGSLSSSAVSIFARDHMSIYANYAAANTQFYLARVLPGSAGRNLTITLFDAGDAQSAGTMKVMPPADANVSNFDDCTYTPPPGNSTGPPWGTVAPTGSNCTISNVQSSTGWNGQWVTWTVPIPSTYTCNATDPNGCWIKMRVNFPSGNVTDTTTWKAALDSDPVRLIH